MVRSTSRSQKCRSWRVRSTFGRSDVVLRGRRKGFSTLQKYLKVRKDARVFVAFSKTMAGVGHMQRICKDGFRAAGAVQETCSSEMLGGQGAGFLREVAFWSIRSSVLGRWFCVTGAALHMTWHQFFVAGAILQRHGLDELCTQLATFEGSLAELLRFWCCQVQKFRKSRRIASFWMLPSSKIEEVRRIAAFSSLQVDRQTGRQTDR